MLVERDVLQSAYQTQPTDVVIDVANLTKVYAGGIEAVKNVSFSVQDGEFFGFLGPNGAGKSTTIKILITLLARSSGSVRILGHDVARDGDAVRRAIGYSSQEASPDDELTARQNLTILGNLYHLDKKTIASRTEELLELMDLRDVAQRSVGTFSGGMRKRLDLALALIHRPRMLFLDEPTTGLDPQNRSGLWHYLTRLNTQEKLTIFLTTHYMEEADKLCDRLAIIDHGQIITEGSPAALKATLGGDLITITFGDGTSAANLQAQRAHEALRTYSFVKHSTPENGNVTLVVANAQESVPLVIRTLDAEQIPVTRLSLSSPSLDDVFLKYTGTRIRQDAPVAYAPVRGPWGARRK